jgi:methylenetetrahydrofolate dehydrogenase (NADP+)/methenyltetrahydrofolate cyclohydrolase
MARLLVGKPIQDQVFGEVRQGIAGRVSAGAPHPRYALVTPEHENGDGAATRKYAEMQQRAAAAVGIQFEHHSLPFGVQPTDIYDCLAQLAKSEFDGIMLGRPLPKDLRSYSAYLANSIPPELDVEGLSKHHVGLRRSNQPCMVPCTVAAVLKIIREYKIVVRGQCVVVIGSSPVTGGPLAEILRQGYDPGKLVVCDLDMPQADRLKAYASADILIAACGSPWLITPEMVGDGVTVIDVGINDVHGRAGFNNKSTVGDVHPDVQHKAAAITPFPGGVGPVTLAMLVQAIYRLWLQRLKVEAAT